MLMFARTGTVGRGSLQTRRICLLFVDVKTELLMTFVAAASVRNEWNGQDRKKIATEQDQQQRWLPWLLRWKNGITCIRKLIA
jgi:hypothetical protein